MAILNNFSTCIGIVFLVFQFCGATTKDNTIQDYRLPKNLVPTNYELKLMPILEEIPGYTRLTTPGSVNIHVDCNENTNSVTLHILDITVTESSVQVRICFRKQILEYFF